MSNFIVDTDGVVNVDIYINVAIDVDVDVNVVVDVFCVFFWHNRQYSTILAVVFGENLIPILRTFVTTTVFETL